MPTRRGQDCHFCERTRTLGVGWSAWIDLGGEARVTGLRRQVFVALMAR